MNRHNTVTRKNVRSGQVVKLSRRYECSCRFLHLISQPDSSPVYHNREMDDNIPAAISILKQNNNHCFHPHPGYSLVTMPENGKRLTREWQPLRAPLRGWRAMLAATRTSSGASRHLPQRGRLLGGRRNAAPARDMPVAAFPPPRQTDSLSRTVFMEHVYEWVIICSLS